MVSCNSKGHVLVTNTDKKLIPVHSHDNLYIDSIPPEIFDYSYMDGYNFVDVSLSQNQNFLPYSMYSIIVNYLTTDIIIGDNTKQIVVTISPKGEIWCFVPPPEFRYSEVVNRPFFQFTLCRS